MRHFIFIFIVFFRVLETQASDKLVLLNPEDRIVKTYKVGKFIQIKLNDVKKGKDTLLAVFVEGYIQDIYPDKIVLTQYSMVSQTYYNMENQHIQTLQSDHSGYGQLVLPIKDIAAVHRSAKIRKYTIIGDLIGVAMITTGFFADIKPLLIAGAPILAASLAIPIMTKDRLYVITDNYLDHHFNYYVKVGCRLEVRKR